MSGNQVLLTVVMIVALAASCVLADDNPATPESDAKDKPATPKPEAKAKPSPDQIAQWVKEMDSDKFDVRDKAVEKLIAAGKPVIGAVTKAAKGESLEVTVRSVRVLKNLLESKDEPTNAAAQAALEELAKDEKHASGREAREVLKSVGPRRPGGGIGQIVLGGGRLIVGAGGRLVIEGNGVTIGGKGMTISVSSVNGKKEINAEENGRKVKINEDKDGIVMAVTEPAKGKKKAETKTYKAADAKELKKKHPEAHKLYEKYARSGIAPKVQIGKVAPARPVKIPRVRPARPKAAQKRPGGVTEARKLLDEAQKDLGKAAAKLQAGHKDKLTAKDWAEIIKQIESARKNLDKARKDLDQ